MIAKTSREYIHEFGLFDDMFEALQESSEVIEEAFSDFENKMHAIKMKKLFESTDLDVEAMYVGEKEGFLSRIGSAVVGLINKIKKFLASIAEKFASFLRKDKEDSAKLNKIIKENPGLKDQIVEGLDKKWFTVSDITKFESDSIALIRMLEQKKIDNQTFHERWTARIEKFNNEHKVAVAATATVATLVTFGPKIISDLDKGRKSLNNITGALAEFKDNCSKWENENDQGHARAVLNAFQELIGINTKYIQQQTEKQTKLSKLRDKYLMRGASDADRNARAQKGGVRGNAIKRDMDAAEKHKANRENLKNNDINIRKNINEYEDMISQLKNRGTSRTAQENEDLATYQRTLQELYQKYPQYKKS